MNQNGTNALCSLISVRLTGPMNLSNIFMDLEISMRVKTTISPKRVILQFFTCLKCRQVVQCEIVVLSLNMTESVAIRPSQFSYPTVISTMQWLLGNPHATVLQFFRSILVDHKECLDETVLPFACFCYFSQYISFILGLLCQIEEEHTCYGLRIYLSAA